MNYSHFVEKTSSLFRFEPDLDDRIKALRENKLWISDPLKFNDPFDVNLNIVDQFDRSSFEEIQYKKAAKLLFENYDESDAHWMFSMHAIQTIKDWATDYPNSCIENIQDAVKAHLKTFGVQCFSQDWKIPLSWAHYSNSHKGYCIEYELAEWAVVLNNSGEFSLHNVIYSNQLTEVCLSEIIFSPHRTLPRLLATKTADWAYEQERRLICFTKKDQAIEMPNGLKMKSLIAGLNASDSLKTSLKSASKYLDIQYFEIEESKYDKTLYKIERD